MLKIIQKYKPKAIFNLAAETHVDRSIDGPQNFIQTNINGTFNLLEALRQFYKKKKIPKLIHISTDEVYGDIKIIIDQMKIKFEPNSPYSASKDCWGSFSKSYIRTFNLKSYFKLL